ncbi:hypothetical protein C9374_000841 [Naegleria lovaniensis]|uniref:Protein kinase domain-containing protein n=1 Tax=Naegleria lovaniensis TaxID=51637 RepID=A0AA88GTA5_NAELO|nr:uncharacterized protein C9374_000841 [Naegleria lovaniensis]KAG2387991.1 hypothetical protein C9374_000841 [Naegleria lovaniensis]
MLQQPTPNNTITQSSNSNNNPTRNNNSTASKPPPLINSTSTGNVLKNSSQASIPNDRSFQTFSNRSSSLPELISPLSTNTMSQTSNNTSASHPLTGSLLFDNIPINDLVSSTPMFQGSSVVNSKHQSHPSSANSTPVIPGSASTTSNSSYSTTNTPSLSSPPSIVTSSTNSNGVKVTSTPTPTVNSMQISSSLPGSASVNTNNINSHVSQNSTNGTGGTQDKPTLTRASSSLSISRDSIGAGFSVGAAAALSPSVRRVYPTTADQYKLLDPIGYGISGPVYEAICIPFNEHVAIKKLDLEKLEDNILHTITKEIHTMVTSFHEHIVNYLTSFTQETELYLVMELMEGGSIYDIMRYKYQDGLPSEELISVVLYQVLEGLAYFHENGQIHRDIKASNILINEDGLVRIGDFGVSANIIEMSGDRRSKRQTFVGSPCWMAPEVMEQFHGYDYKADIWSLGITALELAYGKAPFEGLPPVKVMYMVMEQDPPQLFDTEARKFSKIFKDFVSLCLQKDPTKRPSAVQLLKHKLFAKSAKQKDLIKKIILAGLPPLAERARLLMGFKRSNSQTKITFTMSQTEEEASPFISMSDTTISSSLMSTTVSTQNFDTESAPGTQNIDEQILTPKISSDDSLSAESASKKGVSRWNFAEELKKEEEVGNEQNNQSLNQTKKVEKKGRFEVSETDEDSVEKMTSESPVNYEDEKSASKKGQTKKRNFEVKEVDEIPEEAVITTTPTIPKKKNSVSNLSVKEVSLASLSNQLLTLQNQQQLIVNMLNEQSKVKTPQSETIPILDLVTKLEQRIQELLEENQRLKKENEILKSKSKIQAENK